MEKPIRLIILLDAGITSISGQSSFFCLILLFLCNCFQLISADVELQKHFFPRSSNEEEASTPESQFKTCGENVAKNYIFYVCKMAVNCLWTPQRQRGELV